MSYETILYEKLNGVAAITLNRPQSLNAFVPQMNKEVLEALRDGERDKEVRCFMITGAGRAFCAGQDLKGRTPEQKGSLGASLREMLVRKKFKSNMGTSHFFLLLSSFVLRVRVYT